MTDKNVGPTLNRLLTQVTLIVGSVGVGHRKFCAGQVDNQSEVVLLGGPHGGLHLACGHKYRLHGVLLR